MLIAKTIAVVAVAASFGGFTATAAQAVQADKPAFEKSRAACMKEQGLSYTPEDGVKGEPTKEEKARLAGDYEALRAYRSKYGFGVWSVLVFPKDPVVNPESGVSRNHDMLSKLSASELKTWRAADDKCFAKAIKAVTGKSVTSQRDLVEKVNAAERKGLRAVDSDKKIAALGKQFASCLKVTETRPTVLAARGRAAFAKEATEVAKAQGHGKLPDALEGKEYTTLPKLTPEEAKPYLDREVEAALTDLECGKAFYQAYAPRARAVQERVYREYALGLAL
ncbi:hypothetical protein AB0K16_32545 [Nonomuraea jabiensis]|uniref:hypothetical protein n=1 Tax=Nonomuraea jabiensis TaxID=882448 RepID=UPI00343DC550